MQCQTSLTCLTRPTTEFLGGQDSFSAICLFFGEQIYDETSVPIGLVDASWGGTFIEAWSPPEALASCGVDDDGVGNAQNHNEYLWNAMVHPFLRMSIRGVLWYQVSCTPTYSHYFNINSAFSNLHNVLFSSQYRV